MRLKQIEKELETPIVELLGDSRDDEGFLESTDTRAGKIVYPTYRQQIEEYVFEFLKSYLHALYSGELADEHLQLKSFFAFSSLYTPCVAAPTVNLMDDSGMCLISNPVVCAHLSFMRTDYTISVFLRAFERDEPMPAVKFYISVLGSGIDSLSPKKLSDYIINRAQERSFFRNKILSVNWKFDSNLNDVKIIKISEFSDENLSKIFVPDSIKDELVRFRDTVENYAHLRTGLRFLFSGKPGTAKTKSIRTLINMLYGKATIILNEGRIDFHRLFGFAKLLEPAVVCFDDLDLLIGTRARGFEPDRLSEFLQELDGFDKNNIFLLSTTNNKELVDMAASRPGRFDLVIDFGKIKKENYRDLINSKCTVPEILEVFDDELISTLHEKKVTGAYIVNLIKQLELKHKLNPGVDLREFLGRFIGLSYKGFYEQADEKELKVGFGTSGENGN